jgi:hypothetical protein
MTTRWPRVVTTTVIDAITEELSISIYAYLFLSVRLFSSRPSGRSSAGFRLTADMPAKLTASQHPFSSSSSITASNLQPGATLPPSTHLEGKAFSLQNKRSSELVFSLKCSVPPGDSPSAYASNTVSRPCHVKFIVALRHERRSRADEAAHKEEEEHVKKEQQRFFVFLGRDLKVTCGEMKVVTWENGEKWAVTLQGVGPVWVQKEGKNDAVCLMEGTCNRSSR